MALTETIYSVGMRGLRRVSPLFARGEGKLARGLRGRWRAADRIIEWAQGNRDLTVPLLWVHAPSVGEGLQAASVLRAVRRSGWDGQVFFSHFSPSAESLAKSLEVDYGDYLPWDVSDVLAPVLDSLRPEAVIFTKTEVWPALARLAHQRRTPTYLIAGTLPLSSTRLRPLARTFLRPAFRRLDRVFAIASDDGERFRGLGVPPDRVVVTGDPAVDSAVERFGAAPLDAPYLVAIQEGARPCVVAGSTWPSDEEVVVEAMSRLRESIPDVRLVIAPHEPNQTHLQPLLARLAERGWRVATLNDVERDRSEAGMVDAIVVDRVGVLAELYRAGVVAYVGGGFHGQGLHSVLEPAVAGLPVAFGPRFKSSRAASDLLARGAAKSVATPEELGDFFHLMCGDEGERKRWGGRATGYIEEHRGAADKTAREMLSRIPRR